MTTVKVPYQASVYDMTLQTYGSLDQVYKLIQENPDVLPSIEAPLNTVPQSALTYDETFFVAPSEVQYQAPPVPSPIQTITARRGQSLFDLVLNAYLSLDFTYKLIQDNGVASLDLNDHFGQKFTYDSTLTVDEVVAGNNTAQEIFYCTLVPLKPNQLGHAFDKSFDQSFDAPTS